jgi:hypothetical protein
MKLKFLLFAVLISSILNAQDTIRSLVITEAFVGVPHRNFVELTNMGNDPIQLHNFMVGPVKGDSWTWLENSVDFGPDQGPIRLPEHVLQPGESFLIAQMRDGNPSIPREDWNIVFREWSGTPKEMFKLTDVQIHMNENNWGLNEVNPLDSFNAINPLAGFFGRQAITVQQIFNDTTLIPIDQVHGFWDTEHSSGEFRNKSMGVWEAGYAIAGFQNASVYGHLVRKFSVKQLKI